MQRSVDDLTNIIYKNENNNINYHGHIFITSGSFILDNDWILDSDTYCLIIKNHDFFVKYISFFKLITFSVASRDPLIIYKIGTVCIRIKYMNVNIKKIYYISTIIINLLYVKELFAANY